VPFLIGNGVAQREPRKSVTASQGVRVAAPGADPRGCHIKRTEDSHDDHIFPSLTESGRANLFFSRRCLSRWHRSLRGAVNLPSAVCPQ